MMVNNPFARPYFLGKQGRGGDSTASHGQVEHLDEARLFDLFGQKLVSREEVTTTNNNNNNNDNNNNNNKNNDQSISQPVNQSISHVILNQKWLSTLST